MNFKEFAVPFLAALVIAVFVWAVFEIASPVRRIAPL